jgi:hypothetical protein
VIATSITPRSQCPGMFLRSRPITWPVSGVVVRTMEAEACEPAHLQVTIPDAGNQHATTNVWVIPMSLGPREVRRGDGWPKT